MATITIVKILKNGRCTIPKNVREIEDLREGDYAVLHVGKQQPLVKVTVPSNSTLEAKLSEGKRE